MNANIRSLSCVFLFIAVFSVEAYAGIATKTNVVTIQTSAICESCKNRIEKALKATDGVVSANLNLDNKKIKVKFDPSKITADQIRAAISNTGYDADGVKANADAYKALPPCCQKKGGTCSK